MPTLVSNLGKLNDLDVSIIHVNVFGSCLTFYCNFVVAPLSASCHRRRRERSILPASSSRRVDYNADSVDAARSCVAGEEKPESIGVDGGGPGRVAGLRGGAVTDGRAQAQREW